MFDLHVHSHWSDGEYSPRALVKEAAKMGLSGIALTDHDTLAGFKELKQAGEEFDLPVYIGIEISCVQKDGRQLHLLGYGIPENKAEAVEEFCRSIRTLRNRAVLKSAEVLENAGYPVTKEKVLAMAGPGGDLCKQYIMQILIDAGLCAELYGSLYRTLFKKQENGAPGIAALSFDMAEPIDAVRCITAAGGKAVLAHPGQYDNFDELPSLVDAGLKGIEAFHPKNNESDTKRCLKLAEKYGLAVCGGSDFHGRYGEGEKLGGFGVQIFPF